MTLIDVHCHYEDPKFDGDLNEILPDLEKQNVFAISAGCTVEHSIYTQKLAHQYKNVFFCAGIHPQDAHTFNEEDFNRLKELYSDEKCVAVGEIGLDYYWENNPPKEKQIEVFLRQAALAKEVNLPVEIHSREATGDMLELLKKHDISYGLMHCFSGSRETAKFCLDQGLYFSFGGTCTFKNARKAVENLEYIPRDRILLETDSPYLAPVPVRGTRNDSRNLIHIASHIAYLWGVSVDTVAEITTNNALSLFKKLKIEE